MHGPETFTLVMWRSSRNRKEDGEWRVNGPAVKECGTVEGEITTTILRADGYYNYGCTGRSDTRTTPTDAEHDARASSGMRLLKREETALVDLNDVDYRHEPTLVAAGCWS